MAPGGSEHSLAGNTNLPRTNASKTWCFTYNNYETPKKQKLLALLNDLCDKYIVGHEVGENGTPHLQGWCCFIKKTRPIETIGIQEIHWEKARGSIEDNFKYCSKEDRYIQKGLDRYAEKIKDNFLEATHIAWWQNDILKLISEPPDQRTIHWYWEPDGKVGKTTLAKHICLQYPKSALYLSGKAADIKYAVQQFLEIGGIPRIILFDFPRSREAFISWEAIEEIKNGIFFSGKYEAGMVMFNTPHIICFSNFEPVRSFLSEDRWKVTKIQNIPEDFEERFFKAIENDEDFYG